MKKIEFLMPLLAIILLENCSWQNEHNPNDGKVIGVKLYIDDSLQKIRDDINVYFITGTDTLNTHIFNDSLELPFLRNNAYDIVLKYKGYSLLFDNVPRTMILSNKGMSWKFGIDNKPFNNLLGLMSTDEYKNDKTTRQIYYLLFEPEDMDGIAIVRKRKD
ncbi:MAG: hypothetical protein ABI480_05010 [Chitinophagaceae bacterium]